MWARNPSKEEIQSDERVPLENGIGDPGSRHHEHHHVSHLFGHRAEQEVASDLVDISARKLTLS